MSNRFTHLNYQQNGVSGYDSNEVGYQLNNTRQTKENFHQSGPTHMYDITRSNIPPDFFGTMKIRQNIDVRHECMERVKLQLNSDKTILTISNNGGGSPNLYGTIGWDSSNPREPVTLEIKLQVLGDEEDAVPGTLGRTFVDIYMSFVSFYCF